MRISRIVIFAPMPPEDVPITYAGASALERDYGNLLKDQPYVALAYMTGILPVKKYARTLR